MEQISKLVFCVSFCWFILNSCEKEYSCERCRETNKPPIANAGEDQFIILPIDSVLLNGKLSLDEDGTIVSYHWLNLSGSSPAIIKEASLVETMANHLVEGVYRFELSITDNGGLSSRDTVIVTVKLDTANRPPVAKAGSDQIITLPTNSIVLDGTHSSDPENNIATYAWTKIAGPNTFIITDAGIAQATVSNLTEGVYQFQLQITDGNGLSSKDTVQILVKAANGSCAESSRAVVNAQLVPFATLSKERYGMAVATAGNKILFAGGQEIFRNSWGGYASTRVDIYDISGNTWTTAELSVARFEMAVAVSGSKIFFAGGHDLDFNGASISYANVDIYDVLSNTWSVATLSEPRVGVIGASVGTKVFFAGGNTAYTNHPGAVVNTVDIFDLSTKTSSTSSLSQPRENMSAVSLGDRIYFAGGNAIASVSNQIDIYDNLTNTWSISTLKEPKTNMAAIGFNGKIYWAGGRNTVTQSCQVEIRNAITQTSSFNNLNQPTSWEQSPNAAVEKNNKLIFFTGINADPSRFDIYDVTTDTWSIGLLSAYNQYTGMVSVNNVVYVASDTHVWTLEF